MGLRVPIWKINFCSRVLRLSELPKCKERPPTAICCLEWLGKLKCLGTAFDASLSFRSTSRRCSLNRSPSRRPVSPIGSLSKPRRRRQRERHQTKGLMSKTMAMHVRYKSLYIPWRPQHNNNVKWPSSASSTERGRRRLIFRISIWNWTPSLHIWLKHVHRAIGVPSRSKQSRILLVKYKFIFY